MVSVAADRQHQVEVTRLGMPRKGCQRANCAHVGVRHATAGLELSSQRGCLLVATDTDSSSTQGQLFVNLLPAQGLLHPQGHRP